MSRDPEVTIPERDPEAAVLQRAHHWPGFINSRAESAPEIRGLSLGRLASQVHALAVRFCHSFHDRFAHCRVRMDRANNLMASGFQIASHNRFSNQLRDMGPDHMAAQPLSILLIKTNFYKALSVPETSCFTTCCERPLAHL